MGGSIKYVSIEGNIGAGKSTLLQMLPNSMYKKIVEPVGLYSKFEEHNPLDLCYSHPVSCAPIAQLHITRESERWYREEILRLSDKDSKKPDAELGCKEIIVSERSIISPNIFVSAREHFFHPFVSNFLRREANSAIDMFKPRYTILLSPTPELCYERMQIRGNSFESPVSLSYLMQVDKAHLEALDGKPNNITIEVTPEMSKEQLRDCVVEVISGLKF